MELFSEFKKKNIVYHFKLIIFRVKFNFFCTTFDSHGYLVALNLNQINQKLKKKKPNIRSIYL